MPQLEIVSGGQTGVDRAALDAAIACGLPHGGWCPRGRRAEDGRIPDHYRLQEMPDENYAARTRQNVIDSDGTLILHRASLVTGTALTKQVAEQLGKPLLVINLANAPHVREVVDWIQRNGIRRLNVAGPRESTEPGIYRQAYEFLRRLLAELRTDASQTEGS